MSSPQATVQPDKAGLPVVVVTGATSRAGLAAIDKLKNDFRVVALTKQAPEVKTPEVDWIHVDLTNRESTRAAAAEIKLRHGGALFSVLHLAAWQDPAVANRTSLQSKTVNGTRCLLDALTEFSVQQFVHLSSLLVMEPTAQGQRLQSESEVSDRSLFADLNRQTEEMVESDSPASSTVILRTAGIYSEHCQSRSLAMQIATIYEKRMESYVFPGDSTTGQSMVHVHDLADCLLRTIQRAARLDKFELLLIGEPDVVSHCQLREELGERIHGEPVTAVEVPKSVARAGAWIRAKLTGQAAREDESTIDPEDGHYLPDITQAEQLLGWRPERRLRSSLKLIVDDLLQDPEAWYASHGLKWPSHRSDLPSTAACS